MASSRSTPPRSRTTSTTRINIKGSKWFLLSIEATKRAPARTGSLVGVQGERVRSRDEVGSTTPCTHHMYYSTKQVARQYRENKERRRALDDVGALQGKARGNVENRPQGRFLLP